MDDLRKTGFPLGDGVYAGFTIQELRDSGGIALSVLAAQRRIAGIPVTSMVKDGFTFDELQEAGYDLYGMLNSRLESVFVDVCKGIALLYQQYLGEKCDETESNQIDFDDFDDIFPIDHRIIDPLVNALQLNPVSDEYLTTSAQTLGILALPMRNKTLISSNNYAIPALVEILRGSASDECKEAVTWVLRNLCHNHPANMTAIALAGAIDPLVDQLLDGLDTYKIAAARALCNLACDSSNTAAITSAGAIKPLVELLSHENARLFFNRLLFDLP